MLTETSIEDETATINETPKPKDKQPIKGFVQEKAIRRSQLTDNADYSVAYQVYANNVCRALSLQAQINRAKEAVHAQTNNVDDTVQSTNLKYMIDYVMFLHN